MSKTAAMTANEAIQANAVSPNTVKAVSPNTAKEARQKIQRAQVDQDLELSIRRRPLYDDVEELLTVGFLSHQILVAGRGMSLRSLGPGDLFLLRHRAGLNTTDLTWRVWAVASALWMVDGMCLLEDTRSANKVHSSLQYLSPVAINILFSVVHGLLDRASRAVTRTEAYCYEPYSRVNWRLCGRQIPSKEEITGIPGVNRMGMNHVQRMWLAFNLAEDDRDQFLREWQAAKLVASASSSKGIKKLNRTDESLRNQEENRRRRVIEQMCHMVVWGEEGGPGDEPWTVMVRGQAVDVEPVSIARTAEELEEQFRRWVAGEKDWHDVIVDTYKDRLKAQFQKEQDARDAALTQHRESPGVDSDTRLIGYTLDQIHEARQDLVSRTGGRRVFDSNAPLQLYQKYVAQDARSGKLQADETGVFEASRDGRSLQDQVVRRRPSLSTEPISSPPVEGED